MMTREQFAEMLREYTRAALDTNLPDMDRLRQDLLDAYQPQSDRYGDMTVTSRATSTSGVMIVTIVIEKDKKRED